MNVFVRASRDKTWLALMIHSRETLGLPMLMLDCIQKRTDSGIVVGILTSDALPPNLIDDAERNGLYLLNHGDLKDVAVHIHRAASRLAQIKKGGTPGAVVQAAVANGLPPPQKVAASQQA